jgi:hypothetical protein
MPVQTLAELERVSIVEALRRTNWVVGGYGGAAAQLGLPRTTLISRMRKYGISRNQPSPIVSLREQPGHPIESANFETDNNKKFYARNVMSASA